MRHSSPPNPRWRWFVLLSSFTAFIGTVAYLFRDRPPVSAPAASLTPVADDSVVASQPAAAPVGTVKSAPNSLLLLALLGGVVLCGLGLVMIQDAAPDLAGLLFAVMLVVASVLLVINYRREIITAILSPFRVMTRFYGLHWNDQHRADVLSVIMSLLVTGVLLLVLLLWPVSSLLAGILLVVVLAIVFFTRRTALRPLLLLRRFLSYLIHAPQPEAVPLPALSRWTVAAEWAVIVLFALLVTRMYQSSDPAVELSGHESEWITSSAYAASAGLRQYGRIPLWQPYLEQGEPLVENPVGFIFSPVAIIPSLLVGAPVGLRISVIIHVVLAGMGGWFLARTLGLGTVGRLLLALLLIGKGNMFSMLGKGYFQLALSQVYLPWIIAGIVGILRFPRSRWPVIMTALSAVLVFVTGNVWYILPTIVGAAYIGLPYIILNGQRWIDWGVLRRLFMSAVLTVGLGAVMVIPVLLHFDRIGKHPGEREAGWSVPISDVVPLYFDGNTNRPINIYFPALQINWRRPVYTESEFYYSFVTPDWYVLLLLLIPFYRPSVRWERRLWLVALLLIIFATIWGAGGNPFYIWLYRTFPFIAQWRFVGRALAVASFWIAVLVALRADSLWNIAFQTDWLRLGILRPLARALPYVLGAALLGGGALAAIQVNYQWDKLEHNIRTIQHTADTCLTWLRDTYPDQPLSVWQLDYRHMTTFFNNRVRSWDIQSDFEMTALPSTIGQPDLDLNNPYPQFAFIYDRRDHRTLVNLGYHPVMESPVFDAPYHCIFQRDDYIPYAYTAPFGKLTEMVMPYPTEKLASQPG